jgi:OOP family OmpA-OmpF porin
MRKELKRSIALAALLSALGSGAANATEGWYGRIDAGYSVDGQLDGEVSDLSSGPFDPDLDDDWMAGLGFGYGFQNGFRAEGELSYRTNEWGPYDQPSPVDDTLEGEAVAWAAMANLFYDFNRGGRLQPYVGVGVGGAQVDVSIDTPGYSSADDTVLAYQGIIGIGWQVSERATIDLGYRYFVAPEVDISDAFGAPFTSEVDYEHQAVTLGLRWQFGAAAAPPPPPLPPPPPPPPPPPAIPTCPQSDFVVYFEWDRSNLNQAALETIDAAVARARQCNISQIVVVGHTDTSGSTQYNVGLSERRAGVVRDALVARGIAAGSIRSEARGETDLARPTNDGVREPLNRRTAVTISFR